MHPTETTSPQNNCQMPGLGNHHLSVQLRFWQGMEAERLCDLVNILAILDQCLSLSSKVLGAALGDNCARSRDSELTTSSAFSDSQETWRPSGIGGSTWHKR